MKRPWDVREPREKAAVVAEPWSTSHDDHIVLAKGRTGNDTVSNAIFFEYLGIRCLVDLDRILI